MSLDSRELCLNIFLDVAILVELKLATRRKCARKICIRCSLVAVATGRNAKKHETARTCNFQFLISNSRSQRAISSVVEHLLHTQGVAGSIPASRTLRKTELAGSR